MPSRRLLLAPVLLALPWLAACTATIPLRTSSGTPEVLLRNTDAPLALGAISAELDRAGYRRGWTDGRIAVFHRALDDFQMSVLAGAKWGSEMDLRVTCRLQPRADGLLASATVEVVGNPGTSDETVKDVSAATPYAREVQDCLEMAVGSLALERHARSIDLRERESAAGPRVWTGP